MNYLAHFYLAGEKRGLIIGGFLADFVKGPLKGNYPPDVELGMRLHRKIDSWSDQHIALGNIRKLLPREFGRYAGIIADVLGDHFLSRHWTDHSNEQLNIFSAQKLRMLQDQKELFPSGAQLTLERMKAGQWLTSYNNIDYCLGAMRNIGRRLKRENPLHLLEQPVKQNYEQLGHFCADILSDLKINVAEWRTQHAELLPPNHT